MNEIKIIPIGSSSSGNCFYLEMGGYHLLIDLGIGYKKVKNALEVNGLDLSMIDGVFVTHGHGDHIKAAEVISKRLNCKIYAESSSMYSLRKTVVDRISINTYEDIEIFPGLIVRMFMVPHDFVKTCGYIFKYGDKKVGFVTDCGKMSEDIIDELKGSDVIIIESNHDKEMLKNGPYPKQLQARILSKYGHLSNDGCAKTIKVLSEYGTKNYLLAHISKHNNTYELALKTTRDYIKDDSINIYVCKEESTDLLNY